MQSLLSKVRRLRQSSDAQAAPDPSNANRARPALTDPSDLSQSLAHDAKGPRLSGARRRKFFSYYRPHRGLLLADLACAARVAATALALPMCANFIVERLMSDGDSAALLGDIYLLGGVMLALLAVQALCTIFVDYQGHMMGARMETTLRREMFEHYQKLSFGFYDQQRVGQLMSRISNDLFDLSELYHHGPEDIAIALLKFVGAVAILAYLDLTLTLMILASIPFAVVYALHFNERMGVALRRSKERIAAINEHVEDALSGIRVVKAFGNEAMEVARFDDHNTQFLDTRRIGYRAEAWFHVGLLTYAQLITLLVIVVGAISILGSSMSVADLMTFLLCVAILVDPIMRAANFARLWQEGVTGFHRFMDVMEVVPEIESAPAATALRNVRGEVSFRNVSFKYAGAESYAVRNITLDIAAGEFVALVGYSGVGKTTLCSLIPRFYDVTEGEVGIDGRDVRSVSLASLRENIGLVHQDVYLFAGTVAENLSYGRPDATRSDLEAAARQAQAHEFIQALPRGYDTDIGERGVRLSGGQKQRLTIARAFLKNPPVLIFDEATSALDAESERAVQAALLEIAKGRTTIVIAHRLSTIRNADRIVVLTDAGVVEQGSHDELMAARGAYFGLHDARASL